MSLFQARETEIFETLKQLKGCSFALIGGYAVNAYTLPRFSVDCDIVIKDEQEAGKVGKILKSLGYQREEEGRPAMQYQGSFVRYEKDIGKGIKVSVDVLIGAVLDRQTGVSFSAEWVFQNSAVRALRGKTITGRLDLRITDVEALIALKFVPGRLTDIRDIFMLLPLADIEKARGEIASRVDFPAQFERMKGKIMSDAFRNNLQGVYGLVDSKQFERHKKAFLEFGKLQQNQKPEIHR